MLRKVGEGGTDSIRSPVSTPAFCSPTHNSSPLSTWDALPLHPSPSPGKLLFTLQLHLTWYHLQRTFPDPSLYHPFEITPPHAHTQPTSARSSLVPMFFQAHIPHECQLSGREGSVPSLSLACGWPSSLLSLTLSPLYLCLCVHAFPFHKDTSKTGSHGIYLVTSIKAPFPNTVTSLGPES